MKSKISIFYNAKIYTMYEKYPTAQAVCCKDGKIQAIGSDSEIIALKDADTELIDLNGKTVIPGLIDSHTHYHWYAKSNNELHLLGLTKEEILEEVRKKVASLPKGSWILGSGWVNALFEGGAYPDRAELDRVAPDNPVFLMRCCGNAYWVNSKALELSGIDENTADPGNEMLRRADGTIKGVLVGWFAKNITNNIPDFEDSLYLKMMKQVQNEYFSFGITSISDEGAGAYTAFGTGNGRQTEKAMRTLYESGELALRIYLNVSATQEDYRKEVLARGIEESSYDDHFAYRGVKIWTDGSVGSRTANLTDEYVSNPGVHGKAYYSDEALTKIFKENDERGFQTTCHAIGDAAVRQVIDCYEKAFGADDTKDRRFKIVHFQLTAPELVQKAVKHHIIGSYQFGQFGEDLDGAETSVGKERFSKGYDWRGMIDAGGCICGSSDSPLDSVNPFESMYVGTTRCNLEGKNTVEKDFEKKALTRKEALAAYTLGGAFAQYAEDKKGCLKDGMLADFAVLDRDYFDCPVEEIKEIKVLRTVIGGQTVYES